MKLIDKDALVAEINRIVDVLERNSGYGIFCEYQMVICEKILSFLDTLEVKEVDLDKMLTEFMSRYAYENGGEYPSSIDIAHRFFELGLNAHKRE